MLKNALYSLSLTYPGAAQTALVYRLNRCSDADVAAVSYLSNIGQSLGAVLTTPNPSLSDESNPAQQFSNQLAFYNINLSDSFGLHPPTADLVSAAAAAYVEDVTGDQGFPFNLWPLPLYDPGVPRQWPTRRSRFF